MSSFEVLSHGSCFLINYPSHSPSCWMVGAGHVSYPFKFPNLYSVQDWLQHVTEKHKYDQLELRNEDGEIVQSFRVQAKALHPTRDLMVAAVSENDRDELQSHLKGDSMFLDFKEEELEMNQEVSFHGFGVENSGLENEIHRARKVRGDVNLIAKQRYFAKTEIPLEMGLCGGPVINTDGYCVGVLEGIVNPPSINQGKEEKQFSETYKNAALFVPIAEALQLIDNIGTTH